MATEIGRRLLHTRQVICKGYLRDDGLFEFEGVLEDSKTQAHSLNYKHIAVGEPVHLMRIVMTVDAERVIREIQVKTEAAPTPFCAEVNPAYTALQGLKIAPGFKKKVAECVGGEAGCTHLTELLGRMATTVYQTIATLKYESERRSEAVIGTDNRWVIGGCHAYRVGSEGARRLAVDRDGAGKSGDDL
ncbi:DUF2889 domain-containing protein [Pseudomonas sp. LS44]|uniref:DUF2889 domain-containing protein n=1 Tax=Pseudomonas sp. LS44 TaxID=1357074 RepID=UPI00215B3724|nr:DUF2889 domain-containing protein [Pseudomonas sp. LS44]UVE16011.1 DUF2889 domain-containing protein [Pseudomonas sp. LS44]